MEDLLEDCLAKLNRAEVIIQSLEKDIFNYLNQKPQLFKVIGKHENNGLDYNLIAYGPSTVPRDFSLLTGEIVHHLRSSLDYLIHALVIKNGNQPNINHQFPICTTFSAYESLKKRGRIKGISDSAESLIKSVQPFTSPTPNDTVLYVIGRFNNLDKHQKLVVTTVGGGINENITIGSNVNIEKSLGKNLKLPNIVGFYEPDIAKLSEKGRVVFTIKLAEPAPQLEAVVDFTPKIVFENWINVPIVTVLTGLLAGTKHTVHLFDMEFI